MFCFRPILICLCLAPFSTLAQKKPLDVHRAMVISYGSPSWNTDSAKVDSAYLVMRDRGTNKIVQIQLEETEPDSSKFNGQFSVNLGDTDRIQPEVYVPPQELRQGEKSFAQVYQMIQEGKLPRKPVIWKKNDRGQSVLDVYDTREQAEAALKAYQQQERLALDLRRRKAAPPVPNPNQVIAAQQAERKAELDRLAVEAARQQSDRVRLEQIERQKAEARLKAAQATSEKEREERKAKAAVAAEAALAAYAASDFVTAENKFKESVDLAPNDKSYYFKYGVSLYRNQKFNEALVTLKLAEVEPALEMEKHYYMGLTHYRLKELEGALTEFSLVAKSSDKSLAPSAEFYRGVVFYSQEKFDPAKKSFERVIDTSQDPRLDEQAEAYLDRIANAMAFAKMRENKFTFTGVIGAMYDSNVLLAPDNSQDQGAVTNIGDFRLLTVGDLEYRPVYGERHELSVKGDVSLTNSADTKAAKADPFVYNVAVPYSYKGVIGRKGHKLTLRPAIESLQMDPSGTGTKKTILQSQIFLVEDTLVMSPQWFATYNFEYRRDDSRTADSIGPNDSDANKYSIRTFQSLFLDKSRKQAMVASLGYVKNAAKGSEREYDRYEVGVMYVRPVRWNASWNVGLNLYKLKFPDALEVRDDLNLTFATGLSKPIRDWVTWGITGMYTKNDSNLTANEYSKYLIMTTATFVTNF